MSFVTPRKSPLGRPPIGKVAMTDAERSARYRARLKRRRRRLAPGSNPASCDDVMTPPTLATAIVQHFAPTGAVLDPARGHGAFYNALVERAGVDRVAWCEEADDRNFFDYHTPCDWIVTNPPWSKFRKFLNHAMTLADNIVFLVTLPHLGQRARLRDIASAGFAIAEYLLVPNPPPPWPGGGFQLVAAHIKRGHTGGITVTYN